MDREDTAPASRALDWFMVVVLGATALLVVFGPRLGISEAESGRFLRLALCFLLLFTAYLWLLLRKAQRDLHRMDDLLTDVRFGSGTRRDRDAVDILIRALRTPDPGARETALRTLRKISGLDLGEDPVPWETWWRASRNTFVRSRPPPGKK